MCKKSKVIADTLRLSRMGEWTVEGDGDLSRGLNLKVGTADCGEPL